MTRSRFTLVRRCKLNPGPGTRLDPNQYLPLHHANVRSLTSLETPGPIPSEHKYVKVDEMYSQLVVDCKGDLIALTEPWLDD